MLKGAPGLRDKIEIVTKCDIVAPVGVYSGAPVKYYDTSAAHIEKSVERSLRELATDRIDLLLVHRPDPLMDHRETGPALDRLVLSGKVRAIGVSNFRSHDFSLLQSAMQSPSRHQSDRIVTAGEPTDLSTAMSPFCKSGTSRLWPGRHSAAGVCLSRSNHASGRPSVSPWSAIWRRCLSRRDSLAAVSSRTHSACHRHQCTKARIALHGGCVQKFPMEPGNLVRTLPNRDTTGRCRDAGRIRGCRYFVFQSVASPPPVDTKPLRKCVWPISRPE
jgi:aryl-alcohol dehydrogenase-like predicted oxidoreductase